MKSIKILITFSFLLTTVIATADPTPISPSDPAPIVMLKSTTNQMLAALDKHIGRLKGNYRLIDNLVNQILVPHFDLVKMSQAVIGPYWNKSSGATQQQFIKEFTRYVIRTYSSAMQSYDGGKMRFNPVRGEVGTKVQVSSDLLLRNGTTIQLQYRLEKKGNNWLVYDFSVDGISIVKNYNAQFASLLRTGGLDGLVKELKRRNRS